MWPHPPPRDSGACSTGELLDSRAARRILRSSGGGPSGSAPSPVRSARGGIATFVVAVFSIRVEFEARAVRLARLPNRWHTNLDTSGERAQPTRCVAIRGATRRLGPRG